MTVSAYTVPYYDPSVVFTQTLAAAILVDGDRGAELELRQVTITGVHNDSFDGSNLSSGVRFEGRTRYIGGVNQQQIMEGGRLEISDSRIRGTGFGVQTLWGNRLNVRVTDNTLDARIYALDFVDLGASKVSVMRNTIDAELDGVVVFLQNADLAPLSPSRFTIAQNHVRVNASGGAVELDPTGGYAGISVFDFAALSDPPAGYTFTSDIAILNNDIEIGVAPVKNGIDVSGDGDGDIRVTGNRIRGTPYDSGIFVDLSDGTVVRGNDLRGVEAGVGDVHLTSTTTNVVVVEPGDTVIDEGTNNEVR
jgi:hypothetical protein